MAYSDGGGGRESVLDVFISEMVLLLTRSRWVESRIAYNSFSSRTMSWEQSSYPSQRLYGSGPAIPEALPDTIVLEVSQVHSP